jgi:hypothetical protein
MRSVVLLVVLSLLSAKSTLAAEPGKVLPESIAAFRDICLKTAPTFSGAEEAAKAHGIEEITGSEPKLGFTKDQSMGIQLKANECVVTTPAQANKALTKQFLAAVSEYLKVPVGKKVPALVTIENQAFIIFHDRDDGEAFVLLKKGST